MNDRLLKLLSWCRNLCQLAQLCSGQQVYAVPRFLIYLRRSDKGTQFPANTIGCPSTIAANLNGFSLIYKSETAWKNKKRKGEILVSSSRQGNSSIQCPAGRMLPLATIKLRWSADIGEGTVRCPTNRQRANWKSFNQKKIQWNWSLRFFRTRGGAVAFTKWNERIDSQVTQLQVSDRNEFDEKISRKFNEFYESSYGWSTKSWPLFSYTDVPISPNLGFMRPHISPLLS